MAAQSSSMPWRRQGVGCRSRSPVPYSDHQQGWRFPIKQGIGVMKIVEKPNLKLFLRHHHHLPWLTGKQGKVILVRISTLQMWGPKAKNYFTFLTNSQGSSCLLPKFPQFSMTSPHRRHPQQQPLGILHPHRSSLFHSYGGSGLLEAPDPWSKSWSTK